jgi:hypothetical protein
VPGPPGQSCGHPSSGTASRTLRLPVARTAKTDVMEPRDDRDALGQAPDATVTSEELPARQRLARGWAMVAGAALAFAVVVLLLAWAI